MRKRRFNGSDPRRGFLIERSALAARAPAHDLNWSMKGARSSRTERSLFGIDCHAGEPVSVPYALPMPDRCCHRLSAWMMMRLAPAFIQSLTFCSGEIHHQMRFNCMVRCMAIDRAGVGKRPLGEKVCRPNTSICTSLAKAAASEIWRRGIRSRH